MRLVRHGITRTVWLVGRWAVKVPSLRGYGNGLSGVLWSWCRGVLANQSEAQWWRQSHDPALCPVLCSCLGGVVNIYPRCAPFEATPDQQQAMFDRTWTPVTSRWPSPGDNKPDNFGVLNGRIVRLDYDMNYNGCPHDRSGFINRVDSEAGVR